LAPVVGEEKRSDCSSDTSSSKPEQLDGAALQACASDVEHKIASAWNSQPARWPGAPALERFGNFEKGDRDLMALEESCRRCVSLLLPRREERLCVALLKHREWSRIAEKKVEAFAKSIAKAVARKQGEVSPKCATRMDDWDFLLQRAREDHSLAERRRRDTVNRLREMRWRCTRACVRNMRAAARAVLVHGEHFFEPLLLEGAVDEEEEKEEEV
jgi:hypothetical protein